MIGFGSVTVPAGLSLWHGLGSRFGLGEARGRVDCRAAVVTMGLLGTLVLVEVLVGSR